MLEFSRETEARGYIDLSVSRDIDTDDIYNKYKELALVIMKGGKLKICRADVPV